MKRYIFSSRRTGHIENMRRQRVKYPEVAKRIVDTSDIILEVMDARFPEETRNRKLEEEIEKQGKKIIYVLNKSDLVKDKEINEIKGTLYPYALISCTNKSGIKDLRNLIRIVAKKVENPEKREIKKDKIINGNDNRIKVGAIGYPNTGKSSLLNLLARRGAAGVGPIAGFTKNVQKIKLTSDIVLIDSPGVIPEDQYSTTDRRKISESTIFGGKSYTQVREPEIVINEIFKKYSEQVKKYYNVEVEDSDELIEKVGHMKKILSKGGIVNIDQTSREILKDWQLGKIKT
jgi:ribosome biogenesis GTPase A